MVFSPISAQFKFCRSTLRAVATFCRNNRLGRAITIRTQLTQALTQTETAHTVGFLVKICSIQVLLLDASRRRNLPPQQPSRESNHHYHSTHSPQDLTTLPRSSKQHKSCHNLVLQRSLTPSAAILDSVRAALSNTARSLQAPKSALSHHATSPDSTSLPRCSLL